MEERGLFLSRHQLRQCVKDFFRIKNWDNINIQYPDKPKDLISSFKIYNEEYDVVIAVLPAEYAITLREADIHFYWLKNYPSSRQKGLFLCKGIWESITVCELIFHEINDTDSADEM